MDVTYFELQPFYSETDIQRENFTQEYQPLSIKALDSTYIHDASSTESPQPSQINTNNNHSPISNLYPELNIQIRYQSTEHSVHPAEDTELIVILGGKKLEKIKNRSQPITIRSLTGIWNHIIHQVILAMDLLSMIYLAKISIDLLL